MDEEPIVDCHKCEDLEFARNLVRQMKEGYGRHNSNLSFRDQSDTVRAYHARRALGVGLASEPDRMAFGLMHEASLRELREAQQARVIGRFGERAVQARWEDCDIGDCVAERNMPSKVPEYVRTGCRYFKAIINVPMPVPFAPTGRCIGFLERSVDERMFERVCTHMTSDGGHTWNDHYFWKRIS